MKRILQVFGQADRGGAETRTMEIYRKIDRNKYQFDFLCFGDYRSYDYTKEIESLGGRMLFVKKKLPLQIFEIVRLIEKQGPFLAVHSHISHYSAVIMLAAQIAGVKGRIVHSRTSSDDCSAGWRKIYFFLSSLIIDVCANTFLACSNGSGNYLFTAGRILKRKFSVIPNAINLEEYKKVLQTKSEIRENFNIPEDFVVIGHVGRLEKVKNHDFLLDVFYSYYKNNKKSVLVCVGEGKYRKSIEKKIENLDLRENVYLLGLREDVATLMHMFDVFVMPSFYEGIPGVAIEAQAAGIPCLLSSTISREIDVGTGLLRYAKLSDDIEIWCKKIQDMMEESHISKTESIEILEANGYSVEASVKKFELLYDRILEGLY